MSFSGDSLPFFASDDARIDECLRQVDGLVVRIDTIGKIVEEFNERIKALESAPTDHQVLDALAATVDKNASAAAAELRSQSDALEDLDRRTVQVTLATAEGIERVDRAERRIRSTVQRARKELAEHGYESDGLEAENAEIRLLDAARSGTDGVPPLHLALEPGERDPEERHPQPKGIPGHFSQEVLKALRG